MRPLVFALALFLTACTVSGDPGSGDPGSDDPASAGDAPAGPVVVDSVATEDATVRVRRVADDLEHPWAVAWLPDGRALITERPGTLLLMDETSRTEIGNVPSVWSNGQGGLLDVRLHPHYENTGWIYLSYSVEGEKDDYAATRVARAKLDGPRLTDVETLYTQFPFEKSGVHFDGEIPRDNPFVGRDDIPDEVFAYGHRNQQGMAIHPETGDIWQHEHGPHGGDEFNLVQAGKNYGWPAVTYGDEYSDQSPIGGIEAPGMTQPVTYWDPSPALSGMAFYTGDRISAWNGDLFLGALAHQKLLRLEMNDREVVHQEELLRDEIGRIRDVAMGPDGYLYFLTDEKQGGLYRIEPAG